MDLSSGGAGSIQAKGIPGRLGDALVRLARGRKGSFLVGVAAIPLYVAIYKLFWWYSSDQWFLPVGLRVACMLFTPYRWWPYFFAGDAIALLSLRLPIAEKYTWEWALISPFLIAPLLAMVVLPVRVLLKRRLQDPLYMLPVLVLVSAWAAIYPLVVNNVLSGPYTTLDEFAGVASLFWLGNYLAMITVVPPVLLVINERTRLSLNRAFWREAMLVFACTPLLYAAARPLGLASEVSMVTVTLSAISLPALLMTLRKGYSGAVLGVLSAIGTLSLFRVPAGIAGHIDMDALVMDQPIAVVASLLLVLGAALTRKLDTLRSLGVSEKKALELAQSSFAWAENNMRERLVFMAQMQLRIDEYRKGVVKRLSDSGYAAMAMELNTFAVSHLEWFDQHAAALYPARIEKDGLYAALHDPAFGDLWTQGGEIGLHLRGTPRRLSISLQLAAYRCIANGLVLLSNKGSGPYIVRARTWSSAVRQGISISITPATLKRDKGGVASALAEQELLGRAKAFGGRYRRFGSGRLALNLSEKPAC